MKIKKENFVISLTFCLSLGFGAVGGFASGIPTVDVSAITQGCFCSFNGCSKPIRRSFNSTTLRSIS